MNERIDELMIEAIKAIPDHVDFKLPKEFTEKFAELIVQECVGVVDDAERGGSNEVWDNAVKFIRRDLKEHFGVEQ